MIVTVSLNPAIDSFATAEAIRPIRKIRTVDERYRAGGGGIIAAQVLRKLGHDVRCIFLAGGPTGQLLEDLLAQAAMDATRIAIDGTTRIAHTVFERISGMEYRFAPEGPEVTLNEIAACTCALEALNFDMLILTGSLPRGLPADSYNALIDVASRKSARVVLDTSGPALRAALNHGVFLVKPSLGELEALMGQSLPGAAAQEAAARQLIDAGNTKIVAVSLGRDGAIIVDEHNSWRCPAPVIVARSALGAGDSFVAALTIAIKEGRSLVDALRYAIAAGSAAVMGSDEDGLCAAEVDRLYTESREAALPIGAAVKR